MATKNPEKATRPGIQRLTPAVATFRVYGITPYVQNKFSKQAQDQIMDTQRRGTQARKERRREPKDFQKCYEEALRRSLDGWYGIPATAIKSAMVDACRLLGFKMTLAKQALIGVIPDGYDKDDMCPLVRIANGEPQFTLMPVRNESGVVDLRARPAFPPGWEANIRVEYDPAIFSEDDIANLLDRAGQQVGIGEGRPFSPQSHGMGWGRFRVKE